ncbi:hypothetical protein ACM55H_13115 [Flavobacterium sp. ZT3R17]|uniref:hypothetical protein n=1 Tax=Flavobacterium cryoconiti TaxID=3398736 RepID=UPI003A8C8935
MNIFYDLDEDNLLPKNLIEEYWQNTSGKFTYHVQDLAEKYKRTPKEISSSISNIYSYIDYGKCNACDKKNIETVRNRTRAGQIISNEYYHHFCSSCREKANYFCRNLSEEDKKIVWMKLAFKYKLWLSLDKDELNFLKAIYYLKSWNRIYHELILLDPSNIFKILFKLDSMNLIYYNKNDMTGQISIKMIKDLQDLIEQKLI